LSWTVDTAKNSRILQIVSKHWYMDECERVSRLKSEEVPRVQPDYSWWYPPVRYLGFTKNIIDILSIVPFYISLAGAGGASVSFIRVLRLARILRAFKLRGGGVMRVMIRSLKDSLEPLLLLAISVAMVVLVWLSHHPEMNHGAIADNYVRIAAAKVSAPFGAIFVKGLLCNALVCLAVWLAYAGRSVTDKILAILFPVSAFVAAGFEHCIANFYLIPLGLLLHLVDGVSPAGVAGDGLTVAAAARNIFAATLGNIVGGSVMVAGVYYITFRGAPRGPRA
jgi:formate/nitrite transporter